MAKHLVDLDEQALTAAQATLGTATIKETVNEALRQISSGRECLIGNALDTLAEVTWDDRLAAWR